MENQKRVTNMRGLKPIITRRSLELGDNFDNIKNKIESDSRYAGLKKLELCEFYPEEKRFEYSTERIYPNHSEHYDRIPILLLFSNPHPNSVRRGLFLSEPHSQTFWQRLFESEYFCMTPDEKINLERWDKSTPRFLGQLMLEGKYKGELLLYFHCLWPIPTNQVADLKRLFASTPQLWGKINEDGLKELAELIKHEQVKHIVVFTGEVFHLITGANKADYKGRRDKIKCAVNDYLKDRNIKNYWERLSFCRAKAGFSNDVDVYLALDTRSKNLKIEGTKKRYFTFAIDMILKRILETRGGEIDKKSVRH